VLRDVRSAIRSEVRRAGGREVDARADEFFAVFEQAVAAVEAATAIRRRLNERAWPGGVQVKVRAGIHSGRPTLTDSGYIGLSVHTAARICSVARGGQILVSGEARAGVHGSLPDGVRLRSLGRRSLPGLSQPQAVFQVVERGPGHAPTTR
jgi:class 3 adenylate cyclase